MDGDILSNAMNQGFAVAVAIYSLVRLEKSINENTKVLTVLVERLSRNDREDIK